MSTNMFCVKSNKFIFPSITNAYNISVLVGTKTDKLVIAFSLSWVEPITSLVWPDTGLGIHSTMAE